VTDLDEDQPNWMEDGCMKVWRASVESRMLVGMPFGRMIQDK